MKAAPHRGPKRENLVVKQIILMRHAKSSWDDPELADHERPLAPRGRKAAAAMGEYMTKAGFKPALVLCTSALRGRQTLELLGASVNEGNEVKIEPDIYHESSGELLARLRSLPSGVDSVLLIGHNPVMQELVLALASENSLIDAIRQKFPTAALAVFEADIDEWNELSPGQARLVDFATPKQLPA
jgi:phosphohistidine phosphatase